MSEPVGTQQLGVVGLGVMGENLALNIEEKGFPIAVHNRTPDKVEEFLERHGGKQVVGAKTPAALAASLARPRRIVLMVKAGQAVDDTIAQLLPHLEAGDLIVDGGNEFFRNTERRAGELAAKGFRFLGMGVSGGEEGARRGPSLMPGGERSAYDDLVPILTRIAAQVDDGPCVDYIGPGGAGHYVKMVHNGIEYGDMQLIAECYDLLKHLGGLENPELADVFSAWNEGELRSFLIEITAQIFRKQDPDAPGTFLLDNILDATGMKGTGKWTVQQAAELQAPVPTIASSLDARLLSAAKQERVAAAALLHGPHPPRHPDRARLIEDVRHALYAAKVCSYAQGMNLLRLAGASYGWDLHLGSIARIWKGGCIIRAQFLDRISKAFQRDAHLPNLVVDGEFARELSDRQGAWRRVVATAVQAGIPLPSLSSSLAWYDSYRRERLPANLTQAQRDLFGAHTFERTDRPGSFHADWSVGPAVPPDSQAG